MPSEPARARDPGRFRAWWRELRFTDALLITFLPLVIAVVLLGDAVITYSRTRQFDDDGSRGASVAGAFHRRSQSLLHLPERLVVRQRLNPEAWDPGTIRIEFPENLWARLQDDPQAMWDTYVRGGRLSYGETSSGARLRKRGDNSIHWLTEKRSLSVRTSREEFFKGHRTFGLSLRNVMSAYLANRLAEEFDLLAPRAEAVPVYLNNSFYGMFRFIEPVDEAFLSRVGRIPGTIYRGDRAERGDYFKSVPRGLFENPYLWERTDTIVPRVSPAEDPLFQLLRDIQGTSLESHERLMAKLDREEFGRLMAYFLFIGDPYHMDEVHNLFVYQDPATGLFHPVVWDSRLLDWGSPLKRPLNTWWKAVLRDPFVVSATTREIARRLEDNSLVKVADSLARDLERRYADPFKYDRLREGLIPPVGDGTTAAAMVGNNARVLQRWIDSSVVAMHISPGAVTTVDAETRGYVGAALHAIRFGQPPAGPVALRMDRNLNGVLDPADPSIPLQIAPEGGGIRFIPTSPLVLEAGWNTDPVAIRPGHVAYRFFVTGGGNSNSARLEFANAITGAPAAIEDWPAGTVIETSTALHPWRFSESEGRRLAWNGTMRLRETLRIGPRDTLVIAAGTTVQLDSGVSIVSRGLVRAAGARERPIRITAGDSLRPWGAFALQGHGTDGSLLSHVEFSYGGWSVVDRIEYAGTINVHDADGVRVENVTIRDNQRARFGIRAVQADQFVLTDSRLSRLSSDGIHLEASSGTIARNTIERVGRTGIDLRNADPTIASNRISQARSRGVFVGEHSSPVIFDNLIERSGLAIDVTDRSSPVLLSNDISGNNVGFRQTAVNLRYGGGGWATLVNTAFRDNQSVRGADSVSRLTLGPAGLDSAASGNLEDGSSLAWLYGRFGIAAEPRKAGRVERWSEVAARLPLLSGHFKDDFETLSDGWLPFGGVSRLEKRRGALILETERIEGGIRLPIQLELATPGVLVIEGAGRDVARARLTAVGDQTVRVDFIPGDDLDRFQFIQLTLPAGKYREISLAITPTPGLSHIQRTTGLSVFRAGRFDLRSYAVYPKGGDPMAAAATPSAGGKTHP